MLTTSENLAAEILAFAQSSAAKEMLDKQTTLELKRTLAEFYGKLDVAAVSRYSDRKHGKVEYLVDFCVIREDHSMDTAIESEWTPTLECVEYDFEKLLHVKASLKVMICDSPQYVKGNLGPAVKFLSEHHQAITQGETYMIFNWRGNRAVANCHAWTPLQGFSGGTEEIRFQCVPGFPARVSDRYSHPNDGWLPQPD